MSFQLTHPLPDKLLVAVSGGVDSVAALHWLSRKPGRVRGVLHVNHGTGEYADKAERRVGQLCRELEVPLHLYVVVGSPPAGESREAWWREKRYAFFQKSVVRRSFPVVLAHHLNDCLEEYLMCAMVRGYQGTIPYRHSCCIRPFRKWKKEEIVSYAQRNNLAWEEDPSNNSLKFKRNFIRQEVVPRALQLNPGIYNLVEEAISLQDKRDEAEKSKK